MVQVALIMWRCISEMERSSMPAVLRQESRFQIIITKPQWELEAI